MHYAITQSRCFIIQGSYFNEGNPNLTLNDFQDRMWSNDYEHVSDIQEGLIQVFKHKETFNPGLVTIIVFQAGMFKHSYSMVR